jgi:hypothetical protein
VQRLKSQAWKNGRYNDADADVLAKKNILSQN